VDAGLTQAQFASDETLSSSAPQPLEVFRDMLIQKRRPLSLILPSLDRLIDNLPDFFDAVNRSEGEFPVFLARDALTAAEFLKYYGLMTGRFIPLASVYQPGMSRQPLSVIMSRIRPLKSSSRPPIAQNHRL
jgi:hypothetical protein